jgi:two-component system sensor histidine kinase ChvG
MTSIGRIYRSLLSKLVLLLLAFVAVPIALYVTFEQADRERQALLLGNIQAQGRLVAVGLEPLLERGDPTTFTDVGGELARYADGGSRIRLLFRPRPARQAGAAGFYLVATAPRIDANAVTQESNQLIAQGVLNNVAQSCSIDRPRAQRYVDPSGEEEILTSVVPVLTSAGCWTIIFSYPGKGLLGVALDSPYWQRFEVQLAAVIYLSLALITFAIFIVIRRGVLRFERVARALRLGSGPRRSFTEQTEIAELDGVAAEFDRLVATLSQTADSIRRRAEDNAHAFKTPVAIMRQSLEPLRRAIVEGNVRGQRAVEVMEQAVDRLDHLVDDARRLDESVAELLDPPRRPIDLTRLLRQMTRAYRSLAEGRGVLLQAELSDGMTVLGSEELIETAVEAVLDNAIGFTPAGGKVRLMLARSGARAEIAVADDGPGIPAEHRDRIFERGFSLRPRAEHGGDGEAHAGIGLWMARRYLEALGGGIKAENRGGRGLVMRLDLPLLRPS